MRYVDFGRTGLKVSQFALGTGLLGAGNDGSIDQHAAYAVIATYLDAGGNLIDTAEAYQAGRSEELIGDSLKERRADVVLASKYGRSTSPQASPGKTGNHRKAMMQSVEGSLSRLKTDRIDIYFAHFDDGITPVEEIMRGFDDLVSAGKILYPGLSNFPAWRTARAATIAELQGWAPLSSLEVEYSLLQRTAEREILPLAQAQNLGVLGYSPLAAGMLAAKLGAAIPAKRVTSRNGIESETESDRVMAALAAIAAEAAAEPAQVALSWVVAQGVVPVLGARTQMQLLSLLSSVALQVSQDQLDRLNQASRISLGYPGELLNLVNRKPAS